jgi:hypothetical protein
MRREPIFATWFVLLNACLAAVPQHVFCQGDVRQAVPGKEELAASMKVVRELFEGEFRAARTSEEQATLAKRLVQNAVDTVDDPAGRYALLEVARGIGVVAADNETASLAIDTMARFFEIDALRMKSSVLSQLARKPFPKSAGKQFVSSARTLAGQAIAADRYDVASSLTDLALRQARKLRDAALVKEILGESEHIELIKSQFASFQSALAALEIDPTDPDANSKVGRFHCFVKEEWETGLPMLALGSDGQLKTLAVVELKATRTAAQTIQLADGWWKVAGSVAESEALRVKRHAATHYRAAAGSVTGLPKIKIDKRLEELASLNSAAETGRPTAPVDERWAPIGADGYLTSCYKLGPFPRTAVNDVLVLQFLSKGDFDREFQGTKLTPATTHEGRSYHFHGPQQQQRDHVMYFVFGVNCPSNQVINLRSTTFTRWEHSKVNTYLDARRVNDNGNIPLRKGKHTIVVKQLHMKSDRPGRSWITLAITGESLQQAAIRPAAP